MKLNPKNHETILKKTFLSLALLLSTCPPSAIADDREGAANNDGVKIVSTAPNLGMGPICPLGYYFDQRTSLCFANAFPLPQKPQPTSREDMSHLQVGVGVVGNLERQIDATGDTKRAGAEISASARHDHLLGALEGQAALGLVGSRATGNLNGKVDFFSNRTIPINGVPAHVGFRLEHDALNLTPQTFRSGVSTQVVARTPNGAAEAYAGVGIAGHWDRTVAGTPGGAELGGKLGSRMKIGNLSIDMGLGIAALARMHSDEKYHDAETGSDGVVVRRLKTSGTKQKGAGSYVNGNLGAQYNFNLLGQKSYVRGDYVLEAQQYKTVSTPEPADPGQSITRRDSVGHTGKLSLGVNY